MTKLFYTFGFSFLTMLWIFTGCGKDNPVAPPNGLSASGCVIKSGDIEVIRAEKTVQGEFLLEERVQSGVLTFYLIDKNGKLFQPTDEKFILAWTVKNHMLADVIQYEADGAWNFRIKGFEAGTTSISFKIMDDDFESLDIPITVTKSSGGGLNK